MRNELTASDNDANEKSSWVADVSDLQISDSMHTELSKNKFQNRDNDDSVMVTIARSKIAGLFADGADGIYVKRAPVKSRAEMEKFLVDMLYIGNNGAFSKVKTASDQFLKKITTC